MKTETKLFFEARKEYPELTAKQVSDYIKTKDETLMVQATKEALSCTTAKTVATISKDGKKVFEMVGDEQKAAEWIDQYAESETYNTLLDGLYDFIYEGLKATEIGIAK